MTDASTGSEYTCKLGKLRSFAMPKLAFAIPAVILSNVLYILGEYAPSLLIFVVFAKSFVRKLLPCVFLY